MDIKIRILADINRVAETQFFIKPNIEKALKTTIFNEKGLEVSRGAKTYYDYWLNSKGDRFFDMGTFIRLGSEIENGLKHYYMDKKGHNNLLELMADPNYKMNIFQRILPWTKDGVIDLFKNQLNYDLNSNTKLIDIQ